MSRSTLRYGTDSRFSVLIAAERKGQTARQALIGIGSQVGEEDVAVSVVTLIELGHGVARAETQQRREVRQQFLGMRGGWLWKLPANVPLPAGLVFNNDRPGHYALCPAYNMSVESYRKLLKILGERCERVAKR